MLNMYCKKQFIVYEKYLRILFRTVLHKMLPCFVELQAQLENEIE